jgi:hypothetical protein
MEKKSFAIGDIVTVCFNYDSPLQNVEILYIPPPNDNVWIFRTMHGDLYYVMQFTKIAWYNPETKEKPQDIF